jgi:ABC-2 type transport system permease protein
MMPYLVLKPLSRTRIILEKYAAVVVATTLLLWEGVLLTFLLAMRGDSGDNLDQLVAMLAGGLVGVLAYAALFMLASLVVPRALLAGIIYSLLWETTFARFIPGVRLVSVRHFVLSVYGRLLDNDAFLIDNAMQLLPAVATILALVVVALAAATFRLRTMNLE